MSGWTLAEYQDADGEPSMVRARDLPPAHERARFPVAVRLRWPWGHIASEAEEDAVLDAMIAFENRVHTACEAGGFAMLVAVVTDGAAREWLFQAASGPAFLARLAELGQGQNWPALTPRVTEDPEWTAAQALAPRGRLH